MLAETLGRFLGAMIGAAMKVCGKEFVPIIAQGIRDALADSAEDGKVDPDRVKRLDSAIPSGLRNAGGIREGGATSSTPGDGNAS